MGITEWIGYLASLIVLISLLMSSVKKLRWINLIGSVIFAVYGVLITAIPVAVMNGGIVAINMYYLYQMYQKKDYFRISKMETSSTYYQEFLNFYKEDINTFFTESYDMNDASLLKIFILRNMQPAGLFVGKKHDDASLEIYLDYVISAYRDFKVGDYLFNQQKSFFTEQGITRLWTHPGTEKHQKYLARMGFTLENDIYVKTINS